MTIKTSIILISPYGSNDLLIRFTHSAVRQFKEDFVFALMKCSNAAFGEQNKMKRNISNGEWDEWGEEIFGRQLISIKKTIILISPYGSNDLLIRFTHSAVRQFKDNLLFGLEERHVAGNPYKID